MTTSILTVEHLRKLLHYNPDTGEFTRLTPYGRWNRIAAGRNAGSKHTGGYLVIIVDGKKYYAHRLAWFYMNGVFPGREIDHKNGDKRQNQINNLREATRSENNQNRVKPLSNNKSGFLGVHMHTDGRWVAQIKLGGKSMHIGIYASPEDAHAAYLDVKSKIHPYRRLPIESNVGVAPK